MYSGLSDKVAVVVEALGVLELLEEGCGVGWLEVEGGGEEESRLRGRPAKAKGAERAEMRGAKVL